MNFFLFVLENTTTMFFFVSKLHDKKKEENVLINQLIKYTHVQHLFKMFPTSVNDEKKTLKTYY